MLLLSAGRTLWGSRGMDDYMKLDLEHIQQVHDVLHGFKEGFAAATGKDEPIALLHAWVALAEEAPWCNHQGRAVPYRREAAPRSAIDGGKLVAWAVVAFIVAVLLACLYHLWKALR